MVDPNTGHASDGTWIVYVSPICPPALDLPHTHARATEVVVDICAGTLRPVRASALSLTSWAVAVWWLARRYISRADFERLVRQLIVDKNTRRLGVLRQHAAFAWWPQERLLKLSNFLMPFALPMHAVL